MNKCTCASWPNTVCDICQKWDKNGKDVTSKELLEKNRVRGEGGAPTRASSLPTEAKARKNFPIATGVLDYFPDALVALAEISKAGNDQHNPGLPLRWSRDKSGDESDTCIRHFLQRGTIDTDGMRHTAKAAWRMLALLQKEIERDQDKELTNQVDPVIIIPKGKDIGEM